MNIVFDSYDIVFQEVPNEVSLAFTIKGCPNRCKGCHSPYLRNTDGDILTFELITNIIGKYEDQITTVLFLGGDAYKMEISKMCYSIRQMGYKTAMYSGQDSINLILAGCLDYYKIGRYDEKFGGLDSPTTNQRLYQISNFEMIDITNKMRK